MTTITINNDLMGIKDYTVNFTREFEGYKAGDIICGVRPFHSIPLTLFIAIRRTGEIIFRDWSWTSENSNNYLHVCGGYDGVNLYRERYGDSTPEQRDTVSGLFSGRIKFDGLKLAVGATLQHLCPVDVKREEELTNKKIYLA